MVDKISVHRGHSSKPVHENNARMLKSREHNKNKLWMVTLKVRKNSIRKDSIENKNIGKKLENGESEKTLKNSLKTKDEQGIEYLEPVPPGNRIIQASQEKNLLPVATNLVRDIYAGLNSSGNRELVLSMMPSIFKNTQIRVEKTGRARVRIVIESKDKSALNFFNKFYENIRAGLFMKGVMLDEYRINR